MDLEQLYQKAEEKIFALRSLASLKWEDSMYEPLRLFNEIQSDPKCRAILSNVRKNIKEDPKIVTLYNEHIRKSNLPEKQKNDLII